MISLPSPPARRNVARIGVLAGVFVVAFTVYWTAFPIAPATPLEGRYGGNVVLALEFARTPSDLAAVIGEPGTRDHEAIRASLDRVNMLDYGYLVAYGALLAAGFVGLAGRLGDRRFLAGVPIVLAAIGGDTLENVVLLTLTKADANIASLLPWLRAFTLVKWELLAAVAAALGLGFFREGGWIRRAAGMSGLLAVPVGALVAWNAATFSPVLTLAFVPVWFLVLVACAAEARRAQTPETAR